MGGFSNYQVLLKNTNDQEAVLTQLAQQATTDGYDIVDDTEKADRSIVIGPPNSKGWCSVWDESMEFSDEDSIDKMGRLLSRLSSAAVAVSMFDGDSLSLSLYRHQRLVDCHWSLVDREERMRHGRPRLWGALLVDPSVTADLKSVMRMDDADAWDQLDEFVRLFGWSDEYVATRYRDFEGEIEIPEGSVATHLRLRVRPDYEQKVTGPPVFLRDSQQMEITNRIGTDFDCFVSVRNVGGPDIGMEVTLSGSALDSGTLAVNRVTLSTAQTSPRVQTDAARIDRSGDGIIAQFPEEQIPQGIPRSVYGATARSMEARSATVVHVKLFGDVRGKQHGKLSICIAPVANRENGRMCMELSVCPGAHGYPFKDCE